MRMVVLVNAHARRGTEKLVRLARRALPGVRVELTSALEHCRSCLAELATEPPSLLVVGGGDGTVTTVVNLLRELKMRFPPIAVLPLGTGNACGRITGAPRPEQALERLARLDDQPLPLHRYGLVEVNGTQAAPFAGTGFDAEIASDYREQLAAQPLGLLRKAHSGVRGYFAALFTRTLPRHLFGSGPARVTVTNLGAPAMTVNPRGEVVELPGGERGAVIHEGLAGVAGAATIPEWGYHFRAFPFAEAAPGRLSVRVYGARAFQATRRMVGLWRGAHPLPHMHDFLVEKVRMDFDREVPLQLAGDVAGLFRTIELGIADEHLDLLDWHRLSR